MAPDAVTMSKVVNERESEEVIQQQEKMREQAKVNGKRNDKRIDDLRKMQADLREKFIESNNFARECHEKEYSLDKQIEAERKIQEKLEAEIKDYEERTKNLEDFHENKFKPAIEEMKVYEDVLQEVVDQMDLFKSKEDFLDRCEAICMLNCFWWFQSVAYRERNLTCREKRGVISRQITDWVGHIDSQYTISYAVLNTVFDAVPDTSLTPLHF